MSLSHFILFISCALFVLSARVSSFKFGVIVKSDNLALNDKFIVFGTVPDHITEAEREIIQTHIMNYVKEEIKLKSGAGMEDADKYTMSIMNHKQTNPFTFQSNVVRELSTMLLTLRIQITNNYSNSKSSIWSKVCFYSDPVIVLSKIDLETLGSDHQNVADRNVVYKVQVNDAKIGDVNIVENYNLNLINISGVDVAIVTKKRPSMKCTGCLQESLLENEEVAVGGGELRPKSRSCLRCVIC